MKLAIALITALFLVTPALSAETKDGWGFAFRQDIFDKILFPVARISEEGSGFDKASIAFACDTDGKLVAFFQPEMLMMFTETSKAQFRTDDTTSEFMFSAGSIPYLGKRLILDAAKSEELSQLFMSATSGEIPFRTDKKQGIFTTVGAAQTLKIMKDHCPK